METSILVETFMAEPGRNASNVATRGLSVRANPMKVGGPAAA
jgi:hypothetical protein